MRVAYLFDRPLPATETDSEQALKTVSALGRRGVSVTLILPQSVGGAAPSPAQLADYYQVEPTFGVEHIPNAFERFNNGRKWLHAWRAARTAHRRADEFDLVYTRNFPTLFHLAALTMPYAYETYRPWFEQFPPLAPPFRLALGRALCVGAVLHSEFAAAAYRRLGVDAQRLLVAHNGYEPRHFDVESSVPELRRALALPEERPLVVYAGHINPTKGLDVVLGMARRARHVTFALVGSEGDGLIERLARPHPNVMLVPWQPFDQTARYLLAADVLLQPPSNVPLKLIGNTVLPMKLFSYLAARKPIIAPRSPDTRELLRDGENALLVEPGRVDAAVDALERVLSDSALRRSLSEGAARTAKGLTWAARAEKLESFLAEGLERVRSRA